MALIWPAPGAGDAAVYCFCHLTKLLLLMQNAAAVRIGRARVLDDAMQVCSISVRALLPVHVTRIAVGTDGVRRLFRGQVQRTPPCRILI